MSTATAEPEVQPAAPSGPRSILSELDADQMRAVTAPIGKPALVAAGPGSGKTRVIATRIAWYLEAGIAPDTIYAFTFTNQAARELRERIRRTLIWAAGDDAEAQALANAQANQIYAGTFHSFGASFLRQHAARAGIAPKFSIYDQDDSRGAANRIIKARREKLPQDDEEHPVTPAQLGRFINRMKNTGNDPEAERENPSDPVFSSLYTQYQDMLSQAQALDFNDLVRLPVTLMQRDPELLATARAQCRHVLVDEFQDTNRNQGELARLLAGEDMDSSIYVVGDPDQSIYAFQFARLNNILEFANKDYPGANVYSLNRNYRSQANIVEAANRLIARNRDRIDRKSEPQAPAGMAVQVREYADEAKAADSVIAGIKGYKDKGKGDYEDWCVAYRTNSQSQALEAACMGHGVPYVVRGSFEFYRRAEVSAAIAYLRLALNPMDTAALEQILNVPRRNIGERARAKLLSYADLNDLPLREALSDMAKDAELFKMEQGGNAVPEKTRQGATRLLEALDELREAGAAPDAKAGDVMEVLLHGSCDLERYCRDHSGDGESRWANISRLSDMANVHEGTLQEFCDHARLFQREQPDDGEEDRLVLSTLHQTKGMEWDNVAIVDVEKGVLPHQMARDRKEIEEERRLFYVGCTRAKKTLYLTHRRKNGSGRRAFPSNFLREVAA